MTEQKNLFGEDPFMGMPPQTRHRRTDPETSKEAAHSLGDTRESQKEIFRALRVGPATDPELIERLHRMGSHQSPSGIRTRRSELVHLGLVEDSGERKRLPSGRKAIIWKVTHA